MTAISKRLTALSPIAVGIFALVACQTDLPTAVSKQSAPDHVAASSIYDPSTRTLGLNITTGASRYTHDETRTGTASVVGGNGNYYYEWYVQACYGDSCDEQYLLDAGWGMSSVTISLYETEAWKRITVQVWDSEDLPFSASAQQTLIGPPPAGGGSPAFKCELGIDSYPIHNYYPDHGGAYSAYYRDGCTGVRVYDPNHPKLPWETF